MWLIQGGFNLHICRSCYRIKPPTPIKPPQPNPTHGKSGRLPLPQYEPKSVPEPVETTLNERKWTLTGGIHPSHTLMRLLLNMEHPQRRYLTRVAQHTRRKIHGEIIYTRTQFPWSDWFQNHLESKISHLWYYQRPQNKMI